MTTNSWTATTSGDWFTASNWSEKHIPFKGEDVVIDATPSITVTFNGGADDVNSLTVADDTFDVASGSLTIDGTASFGGALNVSGGTLDFSDASTDLTAFDQTGGTVRVLSGILSLDGAGEELKGAITGAGELYIGGQATIAAGGALSIARIEVDGATAVLTDLIAGDTVYSGAFYLDGGATATLGGGTFSLTGSVESNGGVVNGSGVVVAVGSTTLTGLTLGGTIKWVDRGTVTQSVDDLVIGDTADLTIAVGGTYDISDSSGIDGVAGSMIINSGTFAKTSTSGFTVIDADIHDVGTVGSGGGGLELDGARNYLSGTYTGPGMIDYGAGTIATLGALDITTSACGTNFGTVNVIGDVTFHDGSTMVNDFGAYWSFVGDVGLVAATPGSTSPLFTNYGHMSKTLGTGTSAVDIDATDAGSGVVAVETGTLAFDGAENDVIGLVAGAGTFELGNGGDDTIGAGARFTVANVLVSGGGTVVTFDTNVTYAGAFAIDDFGTLALTGGYLDLTGTTDVADGTVNGGSKLYTKGASTVSGLTIGGTTEWVNSSTVTQDGGDVTIGNVANTVATLYNTSTGVYDIAGDFDIGTGEPASSNIVNAGLIEKTAGTVMSAISPNVVNAGTIEAATGSLDIQGSLTGTGTDEVDAGARLAVGGVVWGSQTLTYSGSGGEIALEDIQATGPQIFHGVISGFGTGDMIEIGAATFFGFKEKTGNASGVLTLHDGSASAFVTMLGDYSNENFSPSIVGGQTVLTFSPG